MFAKDRESLYKEALTGQDFTSVVFIQGSPCSINELWQTIWEMYIS